MRLSDMSDSERQHMLEKIPALPNLGLQPWAQAPSRDRLRVAIITTAGLHRRGDRPFGHDGARNDYRVIEADIKPADLVMSQLSVNFDRTGFQQDINVVFPIERLRELAAAGEVSSVADFHYSFMGAGSPVTRMEPKAREVAALLKQDGVNAVVLAPV
jgi:D-proline reductase (dithiol) PrdB